VRGVISLALVVAAMVAMVALSIRAAGWTDELTVESPLAHVAPIIADPVTPRLAGRVIVVIVDGLRADESHLPYLDELRRRGVDLEAQVPPPTISRPNYVTILTGVPPQDSGVRGNHVIAPVSLDTIMDRVQAAGLRVAVATDFAVLVSLFLRHTHAIDRVGYIEHGTRVVPPSPLTWPADEVRREASLAALGPSLARLAAGDAALIAVHVIDVDHAGHAAGVGNDYRTAAAEVDHMLRGAFAQLDLAHDAVIVTADHGHVASGGHGGGEPEVGRVGLVMAGSGIVPGANARGARLEDVAPTVAALLGVPAPGHAEGRALVEILDLPPQAASRRAAVDAARSLAMTTVGEAARAGEVRPSPGALVLVVLALIAAAALAALGRRHGALVLPHGAGWPAALLAWPMTALALVAMSRGHISPSYLPSVARVEQMGAIGLGAAMVAQVAASWWYARGARDRVAIANGLALVGIATSWLAAGVVHAWYAPPHLEVPSPLWMVAVPAFDAAAIACIAAAVITIVLAALTARSVREPRAPPTVAA
jgi:hypothetical protein